MRPNRRRHLYTEKVRFSSMKLIPIILFLSLSACSTIGNDRVLVIVETVEITCGWEKSE
jgi:hypothetical protein